MVLSIELENNIWVFSPGEIISGKVVLTKPIWNKVEGLKLRIYGKLQPGNQTYLPVVPELLQGTFHCVLDATIVILDNWKVLKPGRHEFPFSYQLPHNVPSSFESKGGRLDYEFISTLKRPRDSFKVYQTRFFVQEIVELKNYPDFQSPIEFTKNAFVGYFCCKSGPFGIKLKLDKTAYVPDQYVKFVAEIYNESSVDLAYIKIIISREFKFHKGKSFRHKEEICDILAPVIPVGDSLVWSGDTLKIPKIPTTSVNGRDIFEINYYLKILLQPSPNNRTRIYEKFEMIIGSNPVQDELPTPTTIRDLSNVGGGDVVQMQNIGENAGSPPSYDEVITADSSIGNVQFVEVTPFTIGSGDYSPSAPLVENIF